MKTGVILLNFGEPESPTMEAVVPFLERIFRTNMALEGTLSPEAKEARIRELAEGRAPGLIEEYEMIGGSPLNAQAVAQADALEAELGRRGHDVDCVVAYQSADRPPRAAARGPGEAGGGAPPGAPAPAPP